MKLSEKTCSPCQGKLSRLTKAEIQNLASQLTNWQVVEEKFLERRHKTKNFVTALEMANKVAMIAEEQNHHPDLLIQWGMLGIKIWTHAADGLTENDFILAAQIDKVMP